MTRKQAVALLRSALLDKDTTVLEKVGEEVQATFGPTMTFYLSTVALASLPPDIQRYWVEPCPCTDEAGHSNN